MNAGIYSLSWDNVDGRVLAAQKKVFDHFGCPVVQHRINAFDHGEWMDFVMRQNLGLELILFVDADAFPVNGVAIAEALEKAAKGCLYGNAQVSHHVDPNRVFVAPSWCCLSRTMWTACGCPSARPDQYSDVGQRWTDVMAKKGVTIEMVLPKKSVVPLWDMPSGHKLGIATTFESAGGAKIFHLFGVGQTTYRHKQYSPERRLELLEEEAARICAEEKGNKAGPAGLR
jgi:hypothetical protein